MKSRSIGYRSEIVGSGGGDYGGDLVIAKGGRRTVVQAKCWKKNVGVKAVQEALGARGYYRADAALVVTNARFTKQAQVLAGKNDVELWDRDELVAALLRAQKGKGGTLAPQRAPVEEAVPQVAASGSELAVAREVEATATAVVAASAAFCARCGDPVSDKVRDYCLAHPARFQGLIYCFRHQRAFKRTR